MYTALGLLASLPVMAAVMLVMDWMVYEVAPSPMLWILQFGARAAVGLMALGGIAAFWRFNRHPHASWLFCALGGCLSGVLALILLIVPIV